MKKIWLDVYYHEDSGMAKACGVVFENWSDKEPIEILTENVLITSEYIPGQFYLRELPCLMTILNKLDLTEFDAIIVDGYIRLTDERPGLGAHLAEVLGEKLYAGLDIIGVAKTKFKDAVCMDLHRGKTSVNPLYCQSHKGNSLECLKELDGEYKIPTLLKIVDHESKI